MTAALVFVALASVARADLPPDPLPLSGLILSNGLEIVLAQDPSVSSVVVLVRYETGAGSETRAQAGYTYLLQQLFAEGTVHRKPGEHAARVERAGGWTTSSASVDDLTLTTEVPRGALELALWLEAERMAGLADAISEQGLASARGKLADAYRGAYVDQPYALVARAIRQSLWPHDHPMAHDVLGDGVAAEHATVPQLRAFAKERITPGNAQLVIAGNFDPGPTLDLAKRYFAWIPGRPRAARTPAALVPQVKATTVEIVAPIAEVVIAYRVPSTRVFDVVAGLLDSDGSPIRSTTVGSGLATSMRVDLVHGDDASELQVHVTPSTAAALDELAADVRAQIAMLGTVAQSPQAVERTVRELSLQRMLAFEPLAPRAQAIAHIQNVSDVVDDLQQITYEAVHAAARDWLSESSSVTIFARATP